MDLEKQASQYAHKTVEGTIFSHNDLSVDPIVSELYPLVFKLIRQSYLDGYGAASGNGSTDADYELFAASTEQGIPLLLSDYKWS